VKSEFAEFLGQVRCLT